MNSLLDIYLLTKLISVMTTNWKDQPAFKVGVIDAKGRKIKSVLKTSAEKDSYSLFYRFAFNLKRLVESLPGGKSKLASYITAYALFKEDVGEYDQAFGAFFREFVENDANKAYADHYVNHQYLKTGSYILLHETVDDQGNFLEKGSLIFVNDPRPTLSIFGKDLYEVFSEKKGNLMVSNEDIQTA